MLDNDSQIGADVGNDGPEKQAACLGCRRSKIKCSRAPGAEACKKCIASGIECVVPEYHVGRYKGVKNKRSGLEKAIFQVEEAVKRARTTGTGVRDEHQRALERLLEQSQGPKLGPKSPDEHDLPTVIDNNRLYDGANTQEFHERSETSNRRPSSLHRHESFAQDRHESGEVIVNNASNPLQLLAIASAIPDGPGYTATPSTNNRSPADTRMTVVTEDDVTQEFFSPISSRLDVGAELDPIDLGLVSSGEVELLFAHFYERLSHTRWGLDSSVHTPEFVRSRSAFLFSSILSAAALFLPDTGALSKRLQNHCKFLVRRVTSGGYRSIEIVLAFMISIPWMQPGKNWAMDDETCYYLSTALTIALDLSLNKIVLPSPTMRPQGTMDKIAQSDCIEAQRALNLDGHTDIDQSSVFGRRLLRARERVWLALFTLDRGVCLSRGRAWTVPIGPLIETCDAWHVSDIADRRDCSMIASCSLRRDFAGLVASIRNTCDSHHFNIGEGSSIVKLMREKVEGFFTQWYNTWSFQIRQDDGRIDPYVEILVSHGKLSAYCYVINHPTASTDVKQFFRAAGLTAALSVIQVAVQNESKLRSMPNNSVIMVSFAACFVLGLSITYRGSEISIAPNAKRSIQEAADVLERIGSSPPHRNGASAMFGKHIKRIIKQHTSINEINISASAENAKTSSGVFLGVNEDHVNGPFTLQPIFDEGHHSFPGFDSMTEDQLLAAIQNSHDDIVALNAGLQSQDGLFMDWLDWPNMP